MSLPSGAAHGRRQPGIVAEGRERSCHDTPLFQFGAPGAAPLAHRGTQPPMSHVAIGFHHGLTYSQTPMNSAARPHRAPNR